MTPLSHATIGSGPPLLIAHGLFGSGRNWGAVAKRLAADFAVTSVDMRNHGDSPWAAPHDYPAMAADLAPLAGGTVLGHSMGGKAAMWLALTRPERVARLVVVDIAPVAYAHDQMGPLEAMRRADLTGVTRRSQAAARIEADRQVIPFLLQSLDLTGAAPRWTLNLDQLAADMPAIVGFPETDATYDGPALFIRGASSDYVADEGAVTARFPAARIVTLPTGHWVHAEAPADVAAIVRDFAA
ncbi:MAG: alpha/beta fold hydrolase [Paracoccaceae bacterium]